MIRSRTTWLGGLLLLAFAAVPARAADIDKFVPEDSEFITSVNVRQLLDSGVVKKVGLEHAKEALKSSDEVAEVLKTLDFDPFKDLDQVIMASPGGNEQDKGLIIAHGKFDVAKFRAKAEETAKQKGDVLKIHKSGANQIYEVKIQGDQEVTLFVAIASKDTILASPGKDYVVDALKKESLKKNAGLKNKQLQTMAEKMDPKQTLSIALVGEAFAKAEIPNEQAKALLAKIDAVSGGVTVTDEVKIEIGVTTKNAADAKDISKAVNDGLNQLILLVGVLSANEPKLAPALDFLKSVKTTTKDTVITIKGALDADAIDKIVDKQKKDF
jgi:hypothetical protein